MWVILGAAALIATASAAGSIFSAASNRRATQRANRTNAQIAADTNAANLQIARETNATNIQLQREMNEYNSYANQRKLAREGGYNPYVVADSASFSPAQTSTPQQVTPQMQPYTVQPETMETNAFQGIAEIAQSVLSAYMGVSEVNLKDSQTNINKINSSFLKELNQANLDKITKQNIGLDLENKFQEQTFSDRIQKIRQEAVSIQLQNYQQYLSNVKCHKELLVFDEKQQLELTALAQEIMYKQMLQGKTYAETMKIMEETVKVRMEAYGIKKQNEHFDKISQSLADAIIAENDFKKVSSTVGKKLAEHKESNLSTIMGNQTKQLAIDAKELTKQYQAAGQPSTYRERLLIANNAWAQQDGIYAGFKSAQAEIMLTFLDGLEMIGRLIPGNSVNLSNSRTYHDYYTQDKHYHFNNNPDQR